MLPITRITEIYSIRPYLQNGSLNYSIATGLGIISITSLGCSFYYSGKLIDSAVEIFQSMDDLPGKSEVAVNALGITRLILGLACFGSGMAVSYASAWMAKKMLKHDPIQTLDQEAAGEEMIELSISSASQRSSLGNLDVINSSQEITDI